MIKHILLIIPLVFTLLTCTPALSEEQPASTDSIKTSKEEQYGSVEERRLLQSLQGEQTSPLAKEREELDNKKKELKRLEAEVDKKIDQLRQLRLGIEKLFAKKDAEEMKRIQEIAKMYEKMTANKAAMILGTVDQKLVVSILSKMKIKSAAKILDNMDREKAAKLTTAFSTLDSH